MSELRYYILLLISVLFCNLLYAQTTLKGIVLDNDNNDPIFSASVVVKGTTVGGTTDFDGNFEFTTNESLPLTIIVSYLGYQKREISIDKSSVKGSIKIMLSASQTILKDIEVVAERISEKQKESALTVESMSLKQIKETPAASFYDGLGNLKGVDLTTASMGFVVINTRGFNSTRPVRSLQLVDGADNQAPGLNFSMGNFVGSSELDIQKVNLVVGASSAFYGPNSFNGVIDMRTKNPFYHRGLSILVKGGEQALFEGGIRYARKFQRKGRDFFAFKVNFNYFRANDWEADNLDAVEGTEEPVENYGGYDAVNRYADENLTAGTNNFTGDFGKLNQPGLGRYYRTGYEESLLVDYDTRNLKAGTALHLKIKEDIEARYAFNFGTGTTVYQGDNRYSLKGLKFYQHQLELTKAGKFFVRAYHTQEDAGDSYDAVFTALLLQQKAKPDLRWNQEYASYWIRDVRDRVQSLPGYPDPNDPAWTDQWFGPQRTATQALADSVLNVYSDSLIAWHAEARAFADGEGVVSFGYSGRFEPGTAEFDSVYNEILSSETFLEGGSKFYDKSSLSHIQGEYIFKPKHVDITVGGNFRMYTPDSRGTIFLDTAGTKITNWEFGFYAGAKARFLDEKLILSFTSRLDKNENFDPLISPAASIVYKQDQNTTWRLSFSSAIRNPTLQDQFLYYNVGRALLIGNLFGFENLVTSDSYFASFEGIAFEKDSLDYFDVDPVRPEKVKTIELGYKGTLFKSLYIDASYFYSWYKDFLGYKIGAEIEIDSVNNLVTNTQFYRVSANSPDLVSTQGFAIGLTYGFKRYYALTGNYSWNLLDRRGSTDEIIPAFNTPEHKFNIGISGQDIVLKMKNVTLRNWGFNMNYKWVQGFLFEGSPQFTGKIPSYDMLDAQINYTNKVIHSTFKLGATNLINKQTFQTYGGPRIGRLIYASILVELGDI